jgi:hypothetical protein
MNVTVRICAFPSLVCAFPGAYPALGRKTGEHAARDYRTPTPTPPGATGLAAVNEPAPHGHRALVLLLMGQALAMGARPG